MEVVDWNMELGRGLDRVLHHCRLIGGPPCVTCTQGSMIGIAG